MDEKTHYNEPPPPYPGGPGTSQPVQMGPQQQAMGAPLMQQPIGFNVPPPPHHGQQIPTVAAVVVNVQGVGPYPIQTTCSNCHNQVMSQTLASPGLLTWILSGTLLLIGCWAGCCLIPCCIPECQDIEHRCPNCKAHLGTFRRI